MDRIYPHDTNAEEATLGSLLLDGAALKTIDIEPGDFYSERNGFVFDACHSLSDRGVGINQITVAQELASIDRLENCGGAAYLSYLINVTPTSLDLKYYAEIVKKLSVKRQLVAFSDQVADIGYNPAGELKTDFEKIDSAFLKLRQKSAPIQIITPAERVKIANERYDKIFYVEGGVALATGLIDLDKHLGGGLMAGDFVVVGARTGVGKTTVLQTIANNIGASQNVLYVSVEMSTESLTDRDVAGYIGVPISTIRRGNYEQTKEGLYGEILIALDEYIRKLHVYHVSGAFTTDNIYQFASTMQTRYGLSAIMVDYLGILRDRYGLNEENRISEITRKLKQISMELKVPLVAAHQLSRASETRDDNRPKLSDLKGSGSIEADADIVLLMYRQNYYGKTEDTTTDIILAKQRQGPANIIVKIAYDQKHQKYVNLAKNDIQEALI